ncbi:MAG: amidohydrolase [Chloroflexota bacterium]
MHTDLVFLNGQVITMGPTTPRAEAVAVVHDRIALVGSDADVRDTIGPETQIIDLKGRALLPGFIDAHCHIVLYGLSRLWLNCRAEVIKDLDELLALVKKAADELEPGQWIRSRGYEDTRLPPRYALTRHDLDKAAPQHPVYLERVCGHVIVVNSRALELAGITRETPDPPGGEIERDQNGEPTGLLRETAREPIRQILPPPTQEELEAAIVRASEDYLAAGITSIQNAGTSAPELKAFQSLHSRGELPLRAYLMVSTEIVDHLIAAGLRTGLGDNRLKIGPLKIFMDGGIGACTAAMRQPYAKDPNNRGILWMEPDELNDLVERAHLAGFQIGTHAIGDWAIEVVLDAYERALTRWPRADHRYRIEHCGSPFAELLGRIVELDVLPVPQPIFLNEGGDPYISNLGHERAHQLYPLRSFLDAGLPISGSSDSPVSSYVPLKGIQTAVTRHTWDGQVLGPGQEISLQEALRMYTLNGAYASFEETSKGSIEVGKLADFAILERDPFLVAPDELVDINVDMTVVGGRIAYRRE